jgi:hypothetical protein
MRGESIFTSSMIGAARKSDDHDGCTTSRSISMKFAAFPGAFAGASPICTRSASKPSV